MVVNNKALMLKERAKLLLDEVRDKFNYTPDVVNVRRIIKYMVLIMKEPTEKNKKYIIRKMLDDVKKSYGLDEEEAASAIVGFIIDISE